MAKQEKTARQIASAKENLEKGAATRFKSGEEAAVAGHKGGIASGEAKREKGRLRTALEMLLEKQYTTSRGEAFTGSELVAVGLFNRAKSGDPRAVKLLAEIIEEYKQSVDLTASGQPVNVVVKDAETAAAVQAILANTRAGAAPVEQSAKPAEKKQAGEGPKKPAKAAKTEKPKATASTLIKRATAKKKGNK